jgi:putative transcriptional regulator
MIMKLENRIRELRARERITQEDLAKSIGVTRQTIISIEKGEYIPSTLLALKIAKFFSVPFEQAFYIRSDDKDGDKN